MIRRSLAVCLVLVLSIAALAGVLQPAGTPAQALTAAPPMPTGLLNDDALPHFRPEHLVEQRNAKVLSRLDRVWRWSDDTCGHACGNGVWVWPP